VFLRGPKLVTRQRFHVRPAVGRGLLLLAGSVLAFGTPLNAQKEVLFLGVGLEEEASAPLPVLAGQPAEIFLRLAASETLAPVVTLDMSAVAGKTATPLVTGKKLDLAPAGRMGTNIQRFRFMAEIPAVERRQQLLLRLRLSTGPGEPAVLLPPLALEALPSTWKESLKLFARDLPLGRLAGSESLDRLLAAAEIDAAVVESDSGPVPSGSQVWLAALPAAEEITLPDAGEALWIVFKPNIGRACRIKRAGHALVVLADARALQLADRPDGISQEMLEHALATARTLLSKSSASAP
jgi:hypothetical protein